jgi:hypothetical protein
MRAPCHVCGGAYEKVDDIHCPFPGGIVVTSGYRCAGCGEEIFDEADMNRLISAAKKVGAWGGTTSLRRKLSRSGRTTVLRIPADIERILHLKGDETVDIEVAGKRKFIVQVV